MGKQGSPTAALSELKAGLQAVPGSVELLALKTEISNEIGACHRRDVEQHLMQPSRGRSAAGRNNSYRVVTPPLRVVTPPYRAASKSPGPTWRGERRPSK